MIKWSILICTLWERHAQFAVLEGKLNNQIEFAGLKRDIDIEILHERDNREMSVGEKRNKLIARAKGEYVNFVDDDDDVATTYIRLIHEAMKHNPDCIGFGGRTNTNGGMMKPFKISLENKSYSEVDDVYLRPPLHLSPIKKSIAEKYSFPHVNQAEDSNYAESMLRDGVIKSEVYIDAALYFYYYDSQRSATANRR